MVDAIKTMGAVSRFCYRVAQSKFRTTG